MEITHTRYHLYDNQPVIGKTLDTVTQVNTALNLPTPDTGSASEVSDIREAAKAFEAEFIAQMLTFSGLDDALTQSGGGDASAFTSFYINSLAEQITEQGGFGLADIFYERLAARADLDPNTNEETSHVDLGRL